MGNLIELQGIAYEFGEWENINHNLKYEIKFAGMTGNQGFLTQDRELRVSKPEPTIVISILTFNKIYVTRIYDNIVTVFEMYKFWLHHMFSVDENEFSYVEKPAAIIQLLKMGWDRHKFWV
jgi:hypothetical protein